MIYDDLLCKISRFLLEVYFLTSHLGGNWEGLAGVMFTHRLHVYAKFGVCSSYGRRDMTDGRTDGHG